MSSSCKNGNGLTEEEKVICRLYLEDLDKYHTCNEYRILMGLLDNEPERETEEGMNDLIDRQKLLFSLHKFFKDGFIEDRWWNSTHVLAAIDELPSAQPQRKTEWIPCSERLPEEDKEVLISYRYKEGEGDTSHVRVDITTYGQMYIGGNKVGNYKHWRAPFAYFESNYEVIAWMPLPESYREVEHDK